MKKTGSRSEKLLAVKYLPELIQDANTITDADSQKEKHVGDHFYYLHQAIEIKGEKKYVIITVRAPKDSKNLYYYNHNVYTAAEYKKIEDSYNIHDNQLSTPGREQEESSVDSNISKGIRVYKPNKTYNQMAGVRAENAPMERLAKAKAMWEAMKPEEEIFRKTGCIRKKDGKWR